MVSCEQTTIQTNQRNRDRCLWRVYMEEAKWQEVQYSIRGKSQVQLLTWFSTAIDHKCRCLVCHGRSGRAKLIRASLSKPCEQPARNTDVWKHHCAGTPRHYGAVWVALFVKALYFIFVRFRSHGKNDYNTLGKTNSQADPTIYCCVKVPKGLEAISFLAVSICEVTVSSCRHGLGLSWP